MSKVKFVISSSFEKEKEWKQLKLISLSPSLFLFFLFFKNGKKT